MARGGVNSSAKEAAALRGGQQMVARGERPVYRVRLAPVGPWYVDGCPWLIIEATTAMDALAATRAAVAEWLGVDPNAFDVEVG